MLVEEDVLVFVLCLIVLFGIFVDEILFMVIYYYFLFDVYEVIFVNDVLMESFFFGVEVLSVLFFDVFIELCEIFLDLILLM